ncbi:F-box protein At4g22390-like [Apium graveolens]|uniref:F-box protein At4g22390-like n=1 Tax=Apium graveolens TaxID=4045 RepID=UPI003D7A7166
MSQRKYGIGFLFLFDSIGYVYKGKKFAVYLPEELLTNIFLRLGVNFLLRCKSVCKTWLSVISNPLFVESQLRRALMTPTLLIIDYPRAAGLPSTNIVNPFPRLFEKCNVVSCSYNGIVCLCDDNDAIYLWNPSIGKFKKLPPATRNRPPCLLRYDKVVFGYDSISDDYKVLKMVYENSKDFMRKVYVYSTKTDSWRRFEDRIMRKLNGFGQTDIVVNGVLYIKSGSELITFDLHREVFGLIRVPDFFGKNMSNVLDFEGSVGIVFKSVGDAEGIFLWTLDDVSGQMQWTKKLRINAYPGSLWWLYCYLGAGLFFGKMVPDHDMFIHHILYDYETEETKLHVRENVCATVKYAKTLVSLNGFEPLGNMPTKSITGKKRSRGSSID